MADKKEAKEVKVDAKKVPAGMHVVKAHDVKAHKRDEADDHNPKTKEEKDAIAVKAHDVAAHLAKNPAPAKKAEAKPAVKAAAPAKVEKAATVAKAPAKAEAKKDDKPAKATAPAKAAPAKAAPAKAEVKPAAKAIPAKVPAGMHVVKAHDVKSHMRDEADDHNPKTKEEDDVIKVKAHDVAAHLAKNPTASKPVSKHAKSDAPKAAAKPGKPEKSSKSAKSDAPAKAPAKAAKAPKAAGAKGALPYVSNGQMTVSLTKSTNSCTLRQIRTVQALGLHKIGDKKVHQDNPAIRGMCVVVSHLVTIEK